ncbi:hypothetical protein DICPUDRAFT_81929 [Dictyostelium purpureum]|uniref:BZIP domain-containing protein n=1 Tax=Dictyostelium purpureum TaxID=5786 RepID=F0ZV06_DICPU|nr:uncharacterized protein DICPUDRAFT_81929 [Dictyostelium purpureum]EGC32223.1 hypothetical protein DICPUDRAFT_81929 [Dictyostelium purpureum]|eukprot:XP_003291259.1 hypothetical protein DICPUDRAFT_81929 [Dictyostelium purpureum]
MKDFGTKLNFSTPVHLQTNGHSVLSTTKSLHFSQIRVMNQLFNKLQKTKSKFPKVILRSQKSFGDYPHSSASQSASSASTNRENYQVLKRKYISLEKQLFKRRGEERTFRTIRISQEGLQSENHIIKSEITILQDKFSYQFFNTSHYTLHQIHQNLMLVFQMQVLIVPIISLNTSEEINGDRIKEIKHEFESYRIAKENLAMETVIGKSKK